MMTGRTFTLRDQVDAARVSDAIAHPPCTQPAAIRPEPAAGTGPRAGMQATRP